MAEEENINEQSADPLTPETFVKELNQIADNYAGCGGGDLSAECMRDDIIVLLADLIRQEAPSFGEGVNLCDDILERFAW